MNELNLPYIVRSMGTLSGIPVRLFRGDELISSYYPVKLPRDPMEICRSEIFSVSNHVGYYVSPLFHYYGVVNSSHGRIVIGPTAQIMADEQALRSLAFRCDVPKDEVSDFVSGMRGIVPMPPENLLQMLCLVNHMLNGGEILELSDIAIYEEEHEPWNIFTVCVDLLTRIR